MKTEHGSQRYLPEINKYQTEARSYALFSIPFFVFCSKVVIDSLLSGTFSRIASGQASDAESIRFVVETVASLTVWHELFLAAEHRVSRMKQAVRDYRNAAGDKAEPIYYGRTTKVINSLMLLHDNSPLPPEG